MFPGTKLAMAVLVKARKVPPGRCIHRNCDGEAQTIGAGRRMCKSCGVTFQQDLPQVMAPLVKSVSLHQEDPLRHTPEGHLPFGTSSELDEELAPQLGSLRSQFGTERNTRTTQSVHEPGKPELKLGHNVRGAKSGDSDRKGKSNASAATSISALKDSLVVESSRSQRHWWMDEEWNENEESLMFFRRIHISEPVPAILHLPPLELSRELSKQIEHVPGDYATLSAKEEALLAQSTLQDSGHGTLIGDFAIQRLKAFNRKHHAAGLR